MQRVSFRTFILLVELFAAVLAYQFLVWTPSAGAATVWLVDEDPNEVTDPNEVLDPNEAQPESIGPCSWTILGEDPNEVLDPNEAQPESVVLGSWIGLDEDPNTPDGEEAEPLPEAAAGVPVI